MIPDAQPETFQNREERLLDYGTLIKTWPKTQERRGSQRKILEFFLLDTLKTIF